MMCASNLPKVYEPRVRSNLRQVTRLGFVQK
jgi:hypothetical protein